MKNLAYLLLGLIVPAAAACVDTAATEDGRDDSFLDDGKADTGGITDGTPEATAVLRVANERSRTQLKDHGVPPLAAQNIVAMRDGDDGSSSADDVVFTTLAQLDAVPYVGPMAFARLLAYANELGYLSPTSPPPYAPTNLWHVAACPKITFAQLVAKFPSGETWVDLQRSYTTTSRHRDSCNSITGCTPWHSGGADLAIYSTPKTYLEMPSGTRGNIQMGLNVSDPSVGFVLFNQAAYIYTDFEFSCTVQQWSGSPMTCTVSGNGNFGETAGFTFAQHGSSYDDKQLVLDGRICADGSYHFISSVLDDQSDSPQNLSQIALYGQLF